MAKITAGQQQTITLAAGRRLHFNPGFAGSFAATLPSRVVTDDLTGPEVVGPFGADASVVITCTGTGSYWSSDQRGQIVYVLSADLADVPELPGSLVQVRDTLPGGSVQQAAWGGGAYSPVSGAGNVFIPLTDDYLGISVAEAAAYVSGGGTVLYKATTYDIGGNTIPLRHNVRHMGQGKRVNTGELLVGGTIIQGNGTAPIFAHNAVDLGAPLPDLPAFLSRMMSGVEVINLALRGGTYGVRGGGLYAPSFWHSKFRDLHIEGCTQWGFSVENYITCDFDNIFVKDCGNSFWFVQSGTSLLNCGNSRADRIFSNFPTANGAGRGVVIGARAGSDNNDMQIRNVTTCSYNITSTQACTMSNGSSDIGVPDISKFALNHAVYFSASVNGVFQPSAYFVNYVSGTSGPGVIRIIDGNGSDAPVVMTGSAAVNVTTKGAGGLELGGLDTISRNTHSSLTGNCDVEAGGTARIVLRGNYSCEYTMGLIGGVESRWHLVERRSFQCRVNSLQPFLSVDTGGSSGLLWIGTYPYELKPGSSLAFIGASGLNISARGGLDMTGQISNLPLRFNRSVGFAQKLFSASGTIDDNSADLIVYNGGAGQTLTMAAISSANVGMVRSVHNVSASSVTLAATAQNITGAGADSTSISIPAKTTVQVKALDIGSGSYAWGLLS